MTFPVVGSNIPSTYQISNSLRFNDNDSAYLSRTPSVASNRRTYTFSFWFKRGNIDSIQHFYTNQIDLFGMESGNYIFFNFNGNVSGGYAFANTLLRDTSAWYHIVCAIDTTNATATDRLKLYLNGERLTPSYINNPSQNYESAVNNTQIQVIGKRQSNNDRYLDGYLSEFNFIDGQALSPTDFGESDLDSGVWKPKQYAGTYGTNGFYLKFNNAGNMGEDSSGNDNTWTPTNLSGTTDVTTDTPTNNFATLNPLDYNSTPFGTATLSEGNCKVTMGDNMNKPANFIVNQGKWYWENKYISSASSQYRIEFGILQQDVPDYIGGDSLPNTSGKGLVWAGFGDLRGYISTSSFGTFAPNDIIGCALDMDAQTLQFYKNGSAVSTAQDFSGAGWTNVSPTVFCSNNAGNEVGEINFGNPPFSISSGNSDQNGYGNFEYAPPSGYLALCTQNLATVLSPTIDDGSQYFNTVLYTGNHPTGQSITGVGFQPDWVWGKGRSHAQAPRLFDSSRGALYNVLSTAANAEQYLAGSLTSFDSDGFTLGSDDSINYNARTFVAWNWKANGGTTSSNTDGSITSTVQANPTAGFSVVTFTGTGANGTFGHGLGAVPKFIIFKNRTDVSNWLCYHEALGNTTANYLNLTNTNAGTSSAFFNNTTPTSSVVSVGIMNEGNGSGDNIVAYCFAEIEGYSKFGSYIGNGATPGPFIYTGFRPAWVMIKRSSSTGNWEIHDNKRPTYNATDFLLANLSNAENTGADAIDFYSNGFKCNTGSRDDTNFNSSTYIYIAFAENPFVTSGATPVTAR